MRNWLFGLLVCAQPAFAGDDLMAMVRDRTLDAIVIARIADRVCPDLQMDMSQIAMAIQHYGFRTLEAIPEGSTRRFLAGFARDQDAACRFADAQYGPGSQTFPFLYRVSPFTKKER